jgi:hypothetical protein
MNWLPHTFRASAVKFSFEMALGAPLLAMTSGRNSVRTSWVAFEKPAAHQILRPSGSVVATSMPLGSLSVTTTWRSWGSATAFVRRSAIRSNTAEFLIFFSCFPVLGLDGVILINNRDPPLALDPGGRGVLVAGARRAHDYREEHSGYESDAPPRSHGRRSIILAAIDEGVFG